MTDPIRRRSPIQTRSRMQKPEGEERNSHTRSFTIKNSNKNNRNEPQFSRRETVSAQQNRSIMDAENATIDKQIYTDNANQQREEMLNRSRHPLLTPENNNENTTIANNKRSNGQRAQPHKRNRKVSRRRAQQNEDDAELSSVTGNESSDKSISGYSSRSKYTDLDAPNIMLPAPQRPITPSCLPEHEFRNFVENINCIDTEESLVYDDPWRREERRMSLIVGNILVHHFLTPRFAQNILPTERIRRRVLHNLHLWYVTVERDDVPTFRDLTDVALIYHDALQNKIAWLNNERQQDIEQSVLRDGNTSHTQNIIINRTESEQVRDCEEQNRMPRCDFVPPPRIQVTEAQNGQSTIPNTRRSTPASADNNNNHNRPPTITREREVFLQPDLPQMQNQMSGFDQQEINRALKQSLQMPEQKQYKILQKPHNNRNNEQNVASSRPERLPDGRPVRPRRVLSNYEITLQNQLEKADAELELMKIRYEELNNRVSHLATGRSERDNFNRVLNPREVRPEIQDNFRPRRGRNSSQSSQGSQQSTSRPQDQQTTAAQPQREPSDFGNLIRQSTVESARGRWVPEIPQYPHYHNYNQINVQELNSAIVNNRQQNQPLFQPIGNQPQFTPNVVGGMYNRERHWNPNNDPVATLFTSEREIAGKYPRDDFKKSRGVTSETIASLYPKPSSFNSPSPDRPYSRFLEQYRMYLVQVNCEPALWRNTMSLYLEGEALDAYRTITENYAFMTFQDLAIELGEAIAPPADPIATRLEIDSLRWDQSREGLTKLAQQIRYLCRDLYAGPQNQSVAQFESAMTFLRLMPQHWRDEIQRRVPHYSLDHYVRAAKQIYESVNASDKQLRYLEATSAARSIAGPDDKPIINMKTGRIQTQRSDTTRVQQKGFTPRKQTIEYKKPQISPPQYQKRSVSFAQTGKKTVYPADSFARTGKPSRAAVLSSAGGKPSLELARKAKSSLGCFNCGSTEHFARNCTVRTSSSEPERQKKNTSVRQVTLEERCYDSEDTSVSGEEPQNPDEEADYTAIEESQESAHESEEDPESAINCITINNINISQLPRDLIGPVLRVPVLLENVPFNAILDCGSPVNIINGVAANRIAASKHNPKVEFWNNAISLTEELNPFRDYNGAPLKAQDYIKLQIQLGDTPVDTIFLVDPTGKQNVLLGTSLMSRLGTKIHFIQPDTAIIMEDGKVTRPQAVPTPNIDKVPEPATAEADVPDDTIQKLQRGPTSASNIRMGTATLTNNNANTFKQRYTKSTSFLKTSQQIAKNNQKLLKSQRPLSSTSADAALPPETTPRPAADTKETRTPGTNRGRASGTSATTPPPDSRATPPATFQRVTRQRQSPTGLPGRKQPGQTKRTIKYITVSNNETHGNVREQSA